MTSEVRTGGLTFRDARVPIVGGRRFWTVVLDEDVDDDAINAAYDELDASHVRGGGPIGIAVAIPPHLLATQSPLAFWPRTRLLYAGYAAGEQQVRVRYFHGALCIDPGPEGPLDFDPTMRAELFALDDGLAVQDPCDAHRDAILELWARGGAVVGPEATRRLADVRTVATTLDGAIVGVGSAYRVHHAQLRLDVWATRAYVAPEHRRRSLATNVNDWTLDSLTARPDGAAGLLLELENVAMRQRLARAVMPTRPFTFIGERGDGATTFVSYFAGVDAPAPRA